MLSRSAIRWHSALQVKGFRNKFIITLSLLVLYALVAPLLFRYIQHRKGFILNDFLLNWLPSYDLSFWIFLLLYALILSAVFVLVMHPYNLLTTLIAYLVLTIFRSVTMLLFPLEPPANIIELNDPLVQQLFYQQSVTKDLFFSGHTSLLVLLALAINSIILRSIFFIGALTVGVMLLFQHAHYTIDVLAAPFFAWLSIFIAKKSDKPLQPAAMF